MTNTRSLLEKQPFAEYSSDFKCPGSTLCSLPPPPNLETFMLEKAELALCAQAAAGTCRDGATGCCLPALFYYYYYYCFAAGRESRALCMAVRGPRGSSALALFAQVSAEFLMHQCKMGCNEVQALLFLAPLVSFFFYFYFFLLILAAISTDGFWALWIGCNSHFQKKYRSWSFPVQKIFP